MPAKKNPPDSISAKASRISSTAEEVDRAVAIIDASIESAARG